jgi:lipoprotein
MNKKALLLIPLCLLAACSSQKKTEEPAKLSVSDSQKEKSNKDSTIKVDDVHPTTTDPRKVKEVEDTKDQGERKPKTLKNKPTFSSDREKDDSRSKLDVDSSQNEDNPLVREANHVLAKYENRDFYEDLTAEEVKQIRDASLQEEKVPEESTYIVSRHPQNDVEDKEYTFNSFLKSYIQSDKESSDDALKSEIIEKVSAAEASTASASGASSVSLQDIANKEFYRSSVGVMSWLLFQRNGWSIDKSTIQLYDFDKTGTYQFIMQWKKGDDVMGYMMGVYYKQLRKFELSAFTMTQKGSLDNYAASHPGG